MAEEAMMDKRMKRLLHRDDRDQKRENARDRSRRNTLRGDDLFRDGMQELVFVSLDADAPAKLEPTFDELPTWQQWKILSEAYAEDEAWMSRLEEEAWAEYLRNEPDEDDYWPESDSDAVWPPAPCYGIDHIEESHLWRERGFIVSNGPWGAKR